MLNYVARTGWIQAQTRLNTPGHLCKLDLENRQGQCLPGHSWIVWTYHLTQLSELRLGGAKNKNKTQVLWRARKVKIPCAVFSPLIFLDDLLMTRFRDISKGSQEINWFSTSPLWKVYIQFMPFDELYNSVLREKKNFSSWAMELKLLFKNDSLFSGSKNFTVYVIDLFFS